MAILLDDKADDSWTAKLKWETVGDRWIAHVIAGDDQEDWYEVSKKHLDWECSLMFHRPDGGEGRAATIWTATFEQAKQIAEQHWETGIWPGGETYK
jgi:hypothetical protein